MNEQRCVQQHRVDPDRPRRAVDGLRLCAGHLESLKRLIAEMPYRYDELQRAGGPGGPRPRGVHSEITVDDAISDHRAQIQHDLLWWCIFVSDERGITRPTRGDVATTATWLGRHVEWLAANEAASEECLPVMRELTGRAIALTDIPAKTVPVAARCVQHRGGQPCDGTVTVVVRGEDWTARCTTDGCERRQDVTLYLHAVPPGLWVFEEDVMVVSALYGIAASPDVVRQWKHRRKIVGISGRDGNAYDLASVTGYLARRKAQRERIAS